MGTISHLEQQVKMQDTIILEIQQQRDLEQSAFRRNVNTARASVENKYLKVQQTLKSR